MLGHRREWPWAQRAGEEGTFWPAPWGSRRCQWGQVRGKSGHSPRLVPGEPSRGSWESRRCPEPRGVFTHRLPQWGVAGPPEGQAFSKTRGFHALGLEDSSAVRRQSQPGAQAPEWPGPASFGWTQGRAGQEAQGAASMEGPEPASGHSPAPAQTPPLPRPTGPQVLSNSGAPPLFTACLRAPTRPWINIEAASCRGTLVSGPRSQSGVEANQSNPSQAGRSQLRGLGPREGAPRPRLHPGVVSPRGDAARSWDQRGSL